MPLIVRPQIYVLYLNNIALSVVAFLNLAKAANLVTKTPGHGMPFQERSNMTTVSFGKNSKMTVLTSERDRIQRFYRDVLGCQVTEKSKTMDIILLGTNFYIGVAYEDSALSESDLLKSIWLELQTNRPEELKQKILKFGIKEIEYPDKKHFYFQAPGGQVFRLAGKTEEMPK